MRPFLSVLICLLLPAISLAQASDFIVVKKRNNRTIKSYFPGSQISCGTVYGTYMNGYVEAVRNDSVFIKQYDIRPVASYYGVSKMDTLTSYITGVHYTELRFAGLQRRGSASLFTNGTLLIIGGLGYAALNVFNGKYLSEPILKGRNGSRLAIAFGVAGAGFLMKYINHRAEHLEKRYHIEYIRMRVPRPRGA